MGALLDAYKKLQAGTLWSSTGKCRGFQPANPGEAKVIDIYVAALDAGMRPAPPVMMTLTGEGIVGMLASLAALSPPSPLPPAKLFGFATGAAPDTYTGMDAASRASYLDLVHDASDYAVDPVIRFDCEGDPHEQTLMADAINKGIDVIPIVIQTGDAASYAARATAVAEMTQSMGIRLYELGNEPNIPGYGLDIKKLGGVSGYTKISNAGYDAIKAVDDGAVVSTAGFSGYGGNYGAISSDGLRIDFRLFYEQFVAAGGLHDAVAVHPYNYSFGPPLSTFAQLTDMTLTWNGFGAMLTLPHSIKATILKNFPSAPKRIWVTEVGLPTAGGAWTVGFSEQTQADYITWCIQQAKAEPLIDVFCLYSVRDRPTADGDQQGHFGSLVRADWSRKPGFAAYQKAVAR